MRSGYVYLFLRVFFFALSARSWVRIRFELETWGWMKNTRTHEQKQKPIVSISFLWNYSASKLFEKFLLHWIFHILEKKWCKSIKTQEKSNATGFSLLSFGYFYLEFSLFFFKRTLVQQSFKRWNKKKSNDFRSFGCFSAKSITCCIYFRLDACALLVGRLVGWLDGRLADSLVCFHSHAHGIARARTT